MKRIIAVLLAVALTGCAGTGDFLQSKGSKTTSYLDDKGMITSQVQEDVSLSDTSQHYQAAEKIIQHVSEGTAAQAASIAAMATDGANSTYSGEAKGLYKAIGMFSIAQLRPDYASALAALGKRPMGMIEGVVDVAKIGLTAAVGITQAKYLKETIGLVADKAGTSIINTIAGDGNTSEVTSKNTKVSTETHNNTVGDDSPATTNNNQTATGCADGSCAKKDKEDGEPAGWEDGGYDYCTPQFLAGIPGCSSCASYANGYCSIKPTPAEPEPEPEPDPEPED